MKKMFRTLALLALVAALLMMAATAVAEDDPCKDGHSGHYEYVNELHCKYICDVCGYSFLDDHAAYCQKLGVCDRCGGVYTGDKLTHWYTYMEYDEKNHWGSCEECGKMAYGPWEHIADCQNPGVCWCGATYTGNNVNHSWSLSDLQYDAETHWAVCENCGEICYGPWEHRAYCTNPNECGECGAPYEGNNTSHLETVYENLGDTHKVICSNCGEYLYNEVHYVYCDEQADVCDACGATGVPFSTYHYWGGGIGHDEANHWDICGRCGEMYWTDAHWESPEHPGECGYCGAPMAAKGSMKKAADGNFYYYNANGDIDTTYSSPAFEFEGGKFMIIEGKLNTNANGVVYVSGPDFFFYANGQVQEVSQLAEYDGSWFLLKNGKVDQSYTDLYTYDGAQFLITEGRLRNDFTGIWTQNGVDYAIVAGQVQ